jgi:Anti-sigma-K factor rskA
MATSEDDRIAYLAGEGSESLPAEERVAMDELRELLRAPVTWEEPDGALEDRVVAAVTREAGRVHADAGRRRARGRARSLRARSALRPWPSRPVLALGAVAAAAIVAVAVAVSQSGTSSKPPLKFAMVVSGTTLATGAHGSATLTKTASGWRIELQASGLPHLEHGLFYEAWLKNSGGVLVPVGTFNDARHVTLWSGVPVTEFRTLSVTRQRADGDPASSGLRVLAGTIRPAH